MPSKNQVQTFIFQQIAIVVSYFAETDRHGSLWVIWGPAAPPPKGARSGGQGGVVAPPPSDWVEGKGAQGAPPLC